tara:strand:+ start:3323 stop:3532 length:210 start_codon:yes stop_codon:yes gene_type:complete
MMSVNLVIEQLKRDRDADRARIAKLEAQLGSALTGRLADAIQEAFSQFEIVDVKDATPTTTTNGGRSNG